jgi:hypothetical protein
VLWCLGADYHCGVLCLVAWAWCGMCVVVWAWYTMYYGVLLCMKGGTVVVYFEYLVFSLYSE